MTGERTFQKYNISKKAFLYFIDSLRAEYRVIGPVKANGQAAANGQTTTNGQTAANGQTVFKEITSAGELFMEYSSTMEPPGKTVFYRPKQDILRFETANGQTDISVKEIPPSEEKCIILGIHPCDINAILYLDRTLQTDPYYMARRQNSILVALNCTSVSEFCFCSSVGTGPHLKAETDVLLTDLGENYLVELKSIKAAEVFRLKGKKAGPEEQRMKKEQENSVIESFKKQINVEGLDMLFIENIDHPVWARTADERCLSCSNCVMVCPTCFCHDIIDEVDMNLRVIKRYRQWDACQDLRFSEVHGGNFRGTRAARLRQFVMHKLNYTGQYGIPGTVGCGRCIKWCPTSIDLTEIAKEIQKNPAGKNA